VRAAADRLKPALIIIDPLFRLTRVKDSNDYTQVTQALEPLLVLARETRAHVLCAHHAGKGNRDGGDSILGSTAIFAAVDTALIMKKIEGYRTLQSEQRYGDSLEETVLCFDATTRTITLGATREAEDTDRFNQAICEYLQGQTDPVTEAVIDDAVEGRTRLKRTALRHLVAMGKVTRYGKGGKADPFKYSLAVTSQETDHAPDEAPMLVEDSPSQDSCFDVPNTISGTREQESQKSFFPSNGAALSCSQEFQEFPIFEKSWEQENGSGNRHREAVPACAVCGAVDRWSDGDVLRCRRCWPPPTVKSQESLPVVTQPAPSSRGHKGTKISWCDFTLNVVIGCSRVSAGCGNCFAEVLSRKNDWTPRDLPWTAKNAPSVVRTVPKKLAEPPKNPQPSRYFLCSLGDLFHDLVPDAFLEHVFRMMQACPWHRFLLLTKRIERASAWPGPWLPHIWLGTSIEDRSVLHRLETLRASAGQVKFVSFEPLLEALGPLDLSNINWCIVGGESGRDFRPMNHAWAREIRDVCLVHNIPFFFKQSAAPRTELGTSLRHEDGRFWTYHEWPDERHAPEPGLPHEWSDED
jgi:protein gp37